MKIKPESAKNVVRRLEKNGFIFTHQKGSHRYFLKKQNEKQFLTCVSMHSGDLPVGTIAAIIRQSGLGREGFYK
ncbi:MAG: type II toxin-antitoxin system HicA family toxin [Candidatus Berkelbacteria bacterium]|nr:type II toxin-antitoxin system HicA family toxin [Candidatus Berkelbacteria bacterium]